MTDGIEGRRVLVTAELALFLAPDAGAKISGQAIAVDGHTETLGGP